MGSPLNEVPDVFVEELNLDWTCSSTNEGLPAALMGSLMCTDGNRDKQALCLKLAAGIRCFALFSCQEIIPSTLLTGV